MPNKITHHSLHNWLMIVCAAILLLIAGTYTAIHMEVDVFPGLNVPMVVIMTEANGMAAKEVEQLVAFPVETAVNGAADVRRVRSSSTNRFSVVQVEFDWGTDIYLARQIINEKLAVVSESLPVDVGKPILGPQSSILGEMLTVSLTTDPTSVLDLRTIVDWTTRPHLLSTGGVAQVATLGRDVKEYQIQLDPERMRRYGISMGEVMAVTRDMSLDANGGVLHEFGSEYIVRGVLPTSKAKQPGEAIVKTVNNFLVTLEGIANVTIGPKAPRLDTVSERGKSAVPMTVTKQPTISTLELTDKLEASLKDLQRNLPLDVKISTDIFRQSRPIESSIGNTRKSLFEGGTFVVIVLFLLLANVCTTLISLMTLPLSLLISILTLHCMGLTIGTMSLGGMAIAIGLLVDDAIVNVENVYKRLRENRLEAETERPSTLEVVSNASKEVCTPILNSALIIVVSFAPLFFLNGAKGRVLVPLGVAFIVALFASTIIALTLTPVLCSYLLRSNKTDKGLKEAPVAYWMKGIYKKALTQVPAHKRVILRSTIGPFVVAPRVFFTPGRNFLPSFNEGSFTINISSLPSISLEESSEMGHRAEELSMTILKIQTVARKTGRAELDEHTLGVNISEIEAPFELKDRSRSELVADICEELGTIAGANIKIGQPINHRVDAMLSGTEANITIKLPGDSLNKIFSFGDRIKRAVSDIPGVVDPNARQQTERPQLKIQPRWEMLAKFSITLLEFSEYANVASTGRVISQVYEQGKSFDLIVKVKDGARDEMGKVRSLMVDTNDDRKVPLSYVVEVVSAMGPDTINRENVKRKIVISANVADRDLRSVVSNIQKRIDTSVQLLEGYHIEYGEQFEGEQAASRTLTLTSFTNTVVIFPLLYNESRNVKESGAILLSLPLTLIDGVSALVITTGEVSIPAIIGFISLFGIATRNGILLINHYDHLQRKEGLNIYDSVIQSSLNRLSPILIAALSSALVLIPLTFTGNLPGSEIQSLTAEVILGGLLASTFLNGFIVPIVYLMMHRKKAQKSL